jgi:hypothetical protein
MGTKQMPETATCQKCKRTIPVKAKMQIAKRVSIPLLVVPSQVDSVEAALAAAICQVCLERKGDPDRGLVEVLKRLGLSDAPLPMLTLSAMPRPSTPKVVPVLATPARDRAPSLCGVSIVSSGPKRSRGSRRDSHRRDNDPKMPKALQPKPKPRPREPIEHLTSAIGSLGDNKAVLEAAMETARKSDAQRVVETAAQRAAERRSRRAKFAALMGSLKRLLVKIRDRAAVEPVHDMVVSFFEKLTAAVEVDPNPRPRGSGGLMELRGTSRDELRELELQVYLEMIVNCDGSMCARTPGSQNKSRTVREIVMMDAFGGVSRPQHWDTKTGGVRVGFYEFEVVRAKRSLPDPNPTPYDGPKVVYPEDGRYGPDYEVHGSQLGILFVALAKTFGEWLLQKWFVLHPPDVPDEPFNMADHVQVFCTTFFKPQFEKVKDQQSQLEPGLIEVDPSTTLSGEAGSGCAGELPATH